MIEATFFVQTIADELNLPFRNVEAVIRLLEEGATVPFLARYRKEASGGMDEVAIMAIRDRVAQLKALEERRESILKSMQERNLLTDALREAILAADNLARLEDIYQPFKPKRRTRATIARERGLEPLATKIYQDQELHWEPEVEAAGYVDPEKEVPDAASALAGARDIIAEWISDDADARAELRDLFLKTGVISTKVLSGKEEEGAKFRDYFDWSESVTKAPSHRILAMRRGESEGMLMMRITIDEEDATTRLSRRFVRASTPASDQVRLAARDAYARLLSVSMETAARVEMKKRADVEATRVFAENLRELLLAPALGEKPIIAIDPGFRTGCKVVSLDAQGKLLFDTVIFPTQSERMQEEAGKVLRALIQKFNVLAIAIGNGTASRETESFVRSLNLPREILVIMVNESGASIYSASEVAREEFPDKDLTVRGAVSIGRRLMDPLAELVKIDPKSIGVGQYQHDVDQKVLKETLEDTVLSCVNNVGVEVNTASKELLAYVSGLNTRLAKEIVRFRELAGPFKSRSELMKVPGLGPKSFEQAAGFLRIRGASHPLDSSAVHPERYALVEKMAADLGVTLHDLIASDAVRKKIKIENYVSEDVGLPTLKDILEELARPGRDPREQFELFQFMEGVDTVADLKPGMKLPGIVTNVTAFGAFVDVGVHQDGLVHVSQLADQFVSNPSEIVKVGQKVHVTVTEVDIARNRIALSMRTQTEAAGGVHGAKQGTQGSHQQGQRGDRKQPHSGNRQGSQQNRGGQMPKQFGGLGDLLDKMGL